MSNKVDQVNDVEIRPCSGDRMDMSVEVFEAIHGLMHLYRSLQFRSLRDGPDAITHMEAKVLGFFGRHPGASPSDLVAHSGRDKAQITRLLGGLKERGLLLSRPDAHDRRSQCLELSAQGEVLQQRVREQAKQLASRGTQGLDAAQCAQLLQLLARLQSNLQSETASVASEGQPGTAAEDPHGAGRRG